MGRGKIGRARLIVIALLVALIAHDLIADRGLGARAAIFAIDRYRAVVSPRLKGKVQCRFVPTCSAYGRAAIEKNGLFIGSMRTIGRIARCNPWTKAGTADPP